MEITTVIPVRNAWLTLARCLQALSRAAQDVPVRLLICENEGSDPSVDMCKSVWLSPTLDEMGLTDHRVLLPMPCSKASCKEQQKYENIIRMWNLFLAHVETKYILMLHADILIPGDGLYKMISSMKGNDRLGAVGIDYPCRPGGTRLHDHLVSGCCLYRVKALEELGSIKACGRDGKLACDCRWINAGLEGRGWEVRKLSSAEAKHVE